MIRKPLAPSVATGRRDRNGAPIRVACSVCHSTRPPNLNASAAKLDEFHQGLKVAHGQVSCLACHDQRNYDRLHLADGKPVAFPDVMTLCGQCHGPQLRDYQHGAHGGMRGYWDLQRGGRIRNTCSDCHDPHAPAYPQVQPVFPPAKDVRHG